jgi:nucleoside-diphosphate-sugar epimerase
MNKKTAVITGATSKVINLLIDKLISAGYNIIAVSRNVKNKEPRSNVKWIVCNLALHGQDFSFLKDSDILFHAASISNFYNREDYMSNNYQSTVNLTDAAIKYGVGKIVYISSILAGYDYGDFGLSKVRSEEYITSHSDNWLIIRPAQLYGYSTDNPIDKLIETIKKRKIVFSPIGDKNGIYPLFYKDLINKITESTILKEESKSVKIIIGPKSYTHFSLAIEIAYALNKKIVIVPIPKLLIQFTYHIINILKLRIGVSPDKLYRFYHCNDSITQYSTNMLSIIDYLQGDLNQPLVSSE